MRQMLRQRLHAHCEICSNWIGARFYASGAVTYPNTGAIDRLVDGTSEVAKLPCGSADPGLRPNASNDPDLTCKSCLSVACLSVSIKIQDGESDSPSAESRRDSAASDSRLELDLEVS